MSIPGSAAGFLALALVVPAVGAASSPTSKPPGDKIEFTSPREITPVKPMTGKDLKGRNEGFNRREQTSVASEVPLAALPSAEDVDRRTRLLLELLERRAEANRQDFDGNGVSLDGSPGDDASDGLLGIDSGRRGRREREDDNGARGENSREEARERDRISSRERDGERGNGSPRDGTTAGDRRSSTAREESAFLPGMDSISILGRDLERRGATDNFLEMNREFSGRSVLREAAEATRSRAERMESFRQLLGTSGGSDLFGTRPGSADPAAGRFGIPGLNGAGVGGGRAPTDSPGSRAAPGPDPVLDRSFGTPNRPTELDLGFGRGGTRSTGESGNPSTPASRPLDSLQRRHDTRLPSRDF